MKKHFVLILTVFAFCSDTYSQAKRHQQVSYWNVLQKRVSKIFSSSVKTTNVTKKVAHDSVDQNIGFALASRNAKKDKNVLEPLYKAMQSGASAVYEYIKTSDGQRNILLAGIVLGVGKVIHGQQHQLRTMEEYNEKVNTQVSALELGILKKIKEMENALHQINHNMNIEIQKLDAQLRNDLHELKNRPELNKQDVEQSIRKQLLEFRNRLDALSGNVGKHNVGIDMLQKDIKGYSDQAVETAQALEKQIGLSKAQHDAINKLWIDYEKTINEIREKKGLIGDIRPDVNDTSSAYTEFKNALMHKEISIGRPEHLQVSFIEQRGALQLPQGFSVDRAQWWLNEGKEYKCVALTLKNTGKIFSDDLSQKWLDNKESVESRLKSALRIDDKTSFLVLVALDMKGEPLNCSDYLSLKAE